MKLSTTIIRRLLTIAVCGIYSQIAIAQNIELKSPNGKLQVDVDLSDKIRYNISSDGNMLLQNNILQLNLRETALGENPKLKSKKLTSAKGEIKPVVPLKFSSIDNSYNQLSLEFKGGYTVEFRAFNDGVAYRFVTNIKGDVEVIGEDMTLNIPADYTVHLQQSGSFKTSNEELYTHMAAKEWKSTDNMANLPILIDTKSNCKILISEADLLDYPGMSVKSKGDGVYSSVFPKAPLEFGDDGDRSVKIVKEADYIAKTKGVRSFPWRYFLVANSDGALVENVMTVKLSSPSVIGDTSWIKPGQVSWEWWNGATPYGADVNFESGFNMDTYKYFIDFAAKFGIKYILMDEGWAKSTYDPYTPNPNVNVHEIIQYGKKKGVDVLLWLTWLVVENNPELFETMSKWGVAGVKVDFMDRTDQWMVNFYERVAAQAAKHKLLVSFHGSFKPSGLEIKYPNVLSYEGVRGMEWMGGCYPSNSIWLPLMRNAVGPMDYTPGAMISMQPEIYRSERPNSASIGTRAYQLSLFVVFDSGLQMLADNPTLYYRERECTDFITSVPVTWDQTKVIGSEAGEYIVVARRKGDKWFIGAMNGNSNAPRDVEISLDFLNSAKPLTMTSFEDGINAGRQAMDYRKKTSTVDSASKVKLHMARNGGWAAVIQ